MIHDEFDSACAEASASAHAFTLTNRDSEGLEIHANDLRMPFYWYSPDAVIEQGNLDSHDAALIRGLYEAAERKTP